MKPILRADPFGPGTIDCVTYFGMFANLCFTTSNPNLNCPYAPWILLITVQHVEYCNPPADTEEPFYFYAPIICHSVLLYIVKFFL